MSDTSYKIKVMQAFEDGEEIECSINSIVWSGNDSPRWNWKEYIYRVKKKTVKMYKYAFLAEEGWEDSIYYYKDDSEFEKDSTVSDYKRLDYSVIEV
jgi:hypothetical protein